MVIKVSKWLFIETLRQIFWLVSTGFTNFETLILVLMSLLLKLNQKRPKFAYLSRKVIKGLNWSQNETKLIYQIQFVVKRSKTDLYELLRGIFLWRWIFKKFKNISAIWNLPVNGTMCLFYQLFCQSLITPVYCNMLVH